MSMIWWFMVPPAQRTARTSKSRGRYWGPTCAALKAHCLRADFRTVVSVPPAPAASSTGQVFIARQPILDRVQHVYAYELLFRDSADAESSGTQSEHASAKVITDAVLAFGLERLMRGRPAFIYVTRSLLLEGIPAVLPPERVVVELLEDIEGDE